MHRCCLDGDGVCCSAADAGDAVHVQHRVRGEDDVPRDDAAVTAPGGGGDALERGCAGTGGARGADARDGGGAAGGAGLRGAPDVVHGGGPDGEPGDGQQLVHLGGAGDVHAGEPVL